MADGPLTSPVVGWAVAAVATLFGFIVTLLGWVLNRQVARGDDHDRRLGALEVGKVDDATLETTITRIEAKVDVVREENRADAKEVRDNLQALTQTVIKALERAR